jgi:hypothetical protein
MFQNPSYGSSEVFVPRDFEARKGEVRTGASLVPTADAELARRILEEIAGFEGATRTSLVSFLSSEFDKDLLERTLDRLQAEGYVSVTPQERSGRTMHGLSLTEKGRTFLGRAR